MEETFGQELRRLRTRKGISLTALSELVHYSKGYLSRVETGSRAATPELASRCDDVLGAGGTLRELVNEREPERAGRAAVLPNFPMPTPHFVGREEALVRLDHIWSANRAVTCIIDGMPGVGKTALAVHWAHHARKRFPGGAILVDSRRAGDGSMPRAVTACLEQLQPASTPLPASLNGQIDLLERLLAGRRVLIVLDNIHSAEQVQELEFRTAGTMLLVTSEFKLPVPSAHQMSLDVLRLDVGVELVAEIIGRHRTDAEPTATCDLVEACGRLPLAIRGAASQLAVRPRWSIASMLARLTDPADPLSVLRLDDGAVGMALNRCYRRLPREAAWALRVTATMTTDDFTPEEASAVLGVDEHTAQHLLDVLVDLNMLETAAPGRYRYHDLVRSYSSVLQPASAADRLA